MSDKDGGTKAPSLASRELGCFASDVLLTTRLPGFGEVPSTHLEQETGSDRRGCFPPSSLIPRTSRSPPGMGRKVVVVAECSG